jgi:hypothetical protein
VRTSARPRDGRRRDAVALLISGCGSDGNGDVGKSSAFENGSRSQVPSGLRSPQVDWSLKVAGDSVSASPGTFGSRV